MGVVVDASFPGLTPDTFAGMICLLFFWGVFFFGVSFWGGGVASTLPITAKSVGRHAKPCTT